METKHIATTAELKDGAEEGRIVAAFSTLDVVDTDGDIVTAGAFTAGQAAPMVWSHDWSRPIGAGAIKVDGNQAIFDGQLWLDTIDGAEAYKKIRHAGGLQEYSWGFRILDADYAERDGQQVRVIKGAELYEVSPVLVGAAGRGRTQTLSLKSGLSFPDQSDAALAAVRDWVVRAKSLADLRQKEGRVLSEANRQRMKDHADALEIVVRDLRDLHAATAPKDEGKAALLAVVMQAQQTLARSYGAA